MNIFLTICLLLVPIFLYLTRKKSSKNLPPGSLGLPIIGHSITFLRALRINTADKWLEERLRKYGPVSKMSILGKPTVFMPGPAGNKFVFTSDSSIITSHQAKSMSKIIGERNLLELNGEDHKRIRGALLLFLKPESLKRYVGKMEVEIRKHFEMNWQGKEMVTVSPTMKSITFNIISSLLIGIPEGKRRDEFLKNFQEVLIGAWSIPINLPLTRYNRSLRSSARIKKMIKELINEKRVELKNGASPHQDLITCLLSMRDEHNKELLTEKEIVDNTLLAMIAGHDTSSVLLTFIVMLLAKNPAIYDAVLKEQEQIMKSKAAGEFLTWEDISKMKYTWRVAQETLRMYPPVFGTMRTAAKDIEYGGYLIPKGWQIMWTAYKTHMESSYFPEPEKFDSTRFENQASVQPYTFVAFGGGPRICPGYELARIETLVTIHYLVTQYTWKLHYTDNAFTRDPMPDPTGGLPIYIFPKKLVQ